jgi:hypothetical protein
MFEWWLLPSDAHPPVPSTLNQKKGVVGGGLKWCLEGERVVAIVSLDLKRIRRRTLNSLARRIA